MQLGHSRAIRTLPLMIGMWVCMVARSHEFFPPRAVAPSPTHAVESSRVAFRRLAQNHRLLQIRSRVLPLHRAALRALWRRLLAPHPRACRNGPAGRYDLRAAPPKRSEDRGDAPTRSQDASWTRRRSSATSTFCKCSARGNSTVTHSERTSSLVDAPSCTRIRSGEHMACEVRP